MVSETQVARPLHRPTAPPAERQGSNPRPDLRVVGAPRHTRLWMLILTAVAVGGTVGIVSLSALAAEQAFEARELQAETEALSSRYTELVVEVAELSAPERVRDVAVTELGMIPAEQPSYVEADWRDSEATADTVTDPLKPVIGAPR